MKTKLLYISSFLITLCALSACEKDDTDFSAYTNPTIPSNGDDDGESGGETPGTTQGDSLWITWNGSTATVEGDVSGLVTMSGADVTVRDDASTIDLVLILTGTSANGSLLVYREKKYTILLNGLSLSNSRGPAINNQCGKALYVISTEGTSNQLADGTTYDSQTFDQKGTFFSEGQMYFQGTGSLSVTGNCRNAIASDDYITIEEGAVVNATTTATGTNGVKANDGFYMQGGQLTVSVASLGGRGIKCDSVTVISGGTLSVMTTGDCRIDTENGMRDTTSAACIKSEGLFTISGGTVTLSSSGDGGKGLSCATDIEVTGGTFSATTSGSNDLAKPKAVKSDTAIRISGGHFMATVKKSWACDNGTDSEVPADRVTVSGSPSVLTLTKKLVEIKY